MTTKDNTEDTAMPEVICTTPPQKPRTIGSPPPRLRTVDRLALEKERFQEHLAQCKESALTDKKTYNQESYSLEINDAKCFIATFNTYEWLGLITIKTDLFEKLTTDNLNDKIRTAVKTLSQTTNSDDSKAYAELIVTQNVVNMFKVSVIYSKSNNNSQATIKIIGNEFSYSMTKHKSDQYHHVQPLYYADYKSLVHMMNFVVGLL